MNIAPAFASTTVVVITLSGSFADFPAFCRSCQAFGLHVFGAVFGKIAGAVNNTAVRVVDHAGNSTEE